MQHDTGNRIGIGSLGFPVTELQNLQPENKTEYLNDFENYLKNKNGKFDFMITGVKKCGTTALTDFSRMHPQIHYKPLFAGEGHYL